MIIYCTTNLINFKKYIGYDSKNNLNYLGSGKIFKDALKKYGKQNFKKQILEHCNSLENLKESEIYWIDYFGAVKSQLFYNIAKGGSGGDMLSDHPNRKEIFNKITNTRRVTYLLNPDIQKKSEKKRIETLNKQRELNGGVLKRPSKTDIVKLKLSTYGCKPIIQLDNNGNFVAEHKSIKTVMNLIKTSYSNIYLSLKNNRICKGYRWIYKNDYIIGNYKIIDFKTIIQFDKKGNPISEFPSIFDASKSLSISSSNICGNCKGRLKTAGGFIWKYKKDYKC